MFRRKKWTQLAKNIIAESERVIEFGEDASYLLAAVAFAALALLLFAMPETAIREGRSTLSDLHRLTLVSAVPVEPARGSTN